LFTTPLKILNLRFETLKIRQPSLIYQCTYLKYLLSRYWAIVYHDLATGNHNGAVDHETAVYGNVDMFVHQPIDANKFYKYFLEKKAIPDFFQNEFKVCCRICASAWNA